MDGKTPLHYAAERGVQATVKALLDRGASAVIADWQGRLPQHLASGKIQSLLMKEAEKQGGSGSPFTHRSHALPRYALPCCALPCFDTLCFEMLCFEILCFAMRCSAMLRCAMLCFATSIYI